VGKRSRRERVKAPTSVYDAGGALELRGSMTPATRREYAELPSATREDAWQRAVEFLFERLAVSWAPGGVEYRKQDELLARFRMASRDERAAIRTALRAHLAEHFPDVEAP
jgi:hypothetical protein